jgi:hypothetical protein
VYVSEVRQEPWCGRRGDNVPGAGDGVFDRDKLSLHSDQVCAGSSELKYTMRL